MTDWHGLYDEIATYPLQGLSYQKIPITRKGSPWLRSPVAGFMSKYDFSGIDVVESVINLVDTKLPWIHSLACLQESVSFNWLGVPLPKQLRIAYASYLFSRPNCRALLFWSQSGLDTVKSYGELNRGVIVDKARVVYPCIRHVSTEDFSAKPTDSINILFSGDFFRKGGVNVVDAFEAVQKDFPNARLRMCCDFNMDFKTDNVAMRQRYIDKIQTNPAIVHGRVARDEMMNQILPQTHIYLLPTYSEAFGYAVLEAMAYGIPVIATDHMAIPELIEHRESGMLIGIQHHDYRKHFRGYAVNEIPADFRNHVTGKLTEYLGTLLGDKALREKIGANGQQLARTKFSVEQRNRIMADIYP
ncbi:hypothetical protein GCM10011369_27840 [Neiella marina]|uniref:Glycosyltransferase n=1 Tax=Neiella marina TaxID=508461 RepID=A0A8J2U7G3_9GAMM|nr:glycosyltransferase family 4 protein [Neiella marina]GGA84246.1 hypothetical protein GCM10011369_27840 [Neiella marina]